MEKFRLEDTNVIVIILVVWLLLLLNHRKMSQLQMAASTSV